MAILVCTTWGYFMVRTNYVFAGIIDPIVIQDAPPPTIPSIVANPVTIPYLSKICKQVRDVLP
jgi:hypothetical protein